MVIPGGQWVVDYFFKPQYGVLFFQNRNASLTSEGISEVGRIHL